MVYPSYDPLRDDHATVIRNAGGWADRSRESVRLVMGRKMWRTHWHTFVTGSRSLCTMREMGIESDPNGKPINPTRHHNGSVGRGVLGKWGVNHAADAVVTAFLDDSLHVLCVLRSEGDVIGPALPGGMVDMDSEPEESFEIAVGWGEKGEAMSKVQDLVRNGTVLYTGVAKDPRNTLNAWVETFVVHAHIPIELALKCNLRLDGDADEKSSFWLAATDANLSVMQDPSHAEYVRMAGLMVILLSFAKFMAGLVVLFLLSLLYAFAP